MSDDIDTKVCFASNKLANARDYYRRYVQDCENPDTFPDYVTELFDIILDLQEEIITELKAKK